MILQLTDENHWTQLSNELALVGAVGFGVFVVLLLADGLELECLYFGCVLVQQPEVGLPTVGHLEQQMEQVVVDSHIGLLVVDLVDFNGDVGLGNRQFHLFPHLECAVQLQPDPHDKAVLHFVESVPVADGLLTLYLSGL